MQGMWKVAVRWLGMVAVCVALPMHAQGPLQITIKDFKVRPIPIAIVPFAWVGTGDPAYDIASVITSDLGNSGRFAPLATRDMISRPTEPSQINFADWRLLRVDNLVIGQLRQTGPDQFQIVFQLFDVQGRQLLGFQLNAGRNDLRAAAHRVSDMIFEELTGIPGVFSTQIAYVSAERQTNNSTRYKLIVSDADGANANTIADSPQPIMSPAWSPDGRRLAYVSFEGGTSAVYVQTLRTGTRERVSERAGVNGSPSFSPDGRQLVLTLSRDGNLDVHTLDLATQVLRQITTDGSIDTEAVFSPDGRYIYFVSDRAGGPQVYRVAPEPGSRAERVTREGIYNARPRVSPDGEWLAVVYGQSNRYRIGRVDIDTGVLMLLTEGRQDESPSFAPNGAQIIYAATENGRGVLASVSTDGLIRLEIASVAGDVREPVWGPYPRP